MDSILEDSNYRELISTIDLRYWCYKPDGSLVAPKGGQETYGRYISSIAENTSPEQIYRQTREYRLKHPDKGIIHQLEASRKQTWAFFMGGGSLLIRYLEYPDQQNPPDYMAPKDSGIVLPLYEFIRNHLSDKLARTLPTDVVLDYPEYNWCLGIRNCMYLVYASKGGSFRLDLTKDDGAYDAKWLDPSSGKLIPAGKERIKGGKIITFVAPDEKDWALWLERSLD